MRTKFWEHITFFVETVLVLKEEAGKLSQLPISWVSVLQKQIYWEIMVKTWKKKYYYTFLFRTASPLCILINAHLVETLPLK